MRNRVRYRRGDVRFRGKHRCGCCLVVNTNHEPSISRNHETPQPGVNRHPAGRGLFVAIVLAGWAVPGTAENTSCTRALGAPVTKGPLQTLGTEPAAADLAVVPGHAYLIEVEERNNDARVEILDPMNEVMVRADHPERRTGTRRAVVTATERASLAVRVTGKEHSDVVGTATVRAFDLAALQRRPDCTAIVQSLAEADANYAAGEEIARGRSTPGTASAREAFVRATEEYLSAERALTAPADRALRGQQALALAGVEYFDLQDWAKTAEWAKAAA